jgi:HlyD family secretion protein
LQSAKKQLEFSTIVVPFDGTILTIQNISEGANITPTSGSFVTLVGGGDLKFVGNVLVQDSDKVQEGQNVTIKLDTKKDMNLIGTISRIAQSKITTPDGKNVIQVDVESMDLQQQAKVGQTGSIEIKVAANGVTTVPSWVVLGGKYVWVIENGQAILKEVKVGQTQDGKTSILSGLSQFDQIITDPEMIIKNKYPIL